MCVLIIYAHIQKFINVNWIYVMTLGVKFFIGIVFYCSLSACSVFKRQHLETQQILSSIRASVYALNSQQESAFEQLSGLQEQQMSSFEQLANLQGQQASSATQLRLLDQQLSALQQSIIDAGLLKQNPYQPIDLVDNISSGGVSPEISVVESAADKMIVGRVEWTWISSLTYYMKARIDTSINVSTLFVDELVEFERDGKKWLQFKIPLDDEGVSRVKVLEKPIQRYTKVKVDDSEAVRQPVISLVIGVGTTTDEIEFLVSKRTQVTYPVVLGKNFLTDIALVDVAQKFVYPRDEKKLKATADMFSKMQSVVPTQTVPANLPSE